MSVAILRVRLSPEAPEEEYEQCAARLSELTERMPGMCHTRDSWPQDGEQVTIVEFESEDDMRAWAGHPEHVAAKRKRRTFYSEVRAPVCATLGKSV